MWLMAPILPDNHRTSPMQCLARPEPHQADIIEMRIYVIYNKGAWSWNQPRINGWKQSPVIQGVGIEYVQQNVTRAHIDR